MFAQTLANHPPSGPFIILSSVDSTNNYAMAKLHAGMLVPGSCLLAIEQTAGKGQRGKEWLVQPGRNITMTAVYQPGSYNPFIYSAAMALACHDFILGFGLNGVSIKWPNDIFIGDRKAAGILIENVYRGPVWEWAITGMGVNLNQEEFPSLGQKAISVKQVSGKENDLVASGRSLHRYIQMRYEWLKAVSFLEVMNEYNSRLYKKGKEIKLKKGTILFNTVIKEVLPNGELVCSDTMERNFTVGEVEFV